MDAVSNFISRLTGSPASTAATNSNSISPPANESNNNNNNSAAATTTTTTVPHKPRGILKNASDADKYRSSESYPISDNLDESLENAQKNCTLNLRKNKKFLRKNVLISSQSQSGTQSAELEAEIAKDFRWDEDNLELNEAERVPRMKIDEPKTPYHADYDPNADANDSTDATATANNPTNNTNADVVNESANAELIMDMEEELILDTNPMMDSMDMSLDDDQSTVDSYNNNNTTQTQTQTQNQTQNQNTAQQHQSLLLADDAYRQKMVNDALQRRNNDMTQTQAQTQEQTHAQAPQTQTQPKIVSEWDMDDDNDNDNDNDSNANDSSTAATTADPQQKKQLTEKELRKQRFKAKRSAHYNEYHVIRAKDALNTT